MSDIEQLSAGELRDMAENSQWFHAIDFGDFSSSGRFPAGTPQNSTLYGAMEFLSKIDLRGKRVLDIGCSDGLAAFGMKALGAEEVVTIDLYDLPTFRIARQLLGLDIDYHPRVTVQDAVARFGWKQFDVILCAGVIYHMLNPMSAFTECRKLLKDGGLLIMESPINPDVNEAVLTLNTESEQAYKEIYTYWIPTQAAMTGMMKLVGIDVLGARFLKGPPRLTLIGRAGPRDDVKDRSELLERVHEADLCDFQFRFCDLEQHPGETSVPLGKIEPYRVIDAAKEEVVFPFHPAAGSQGLGRTRWISRNRNY